MMNSVTKGLKNLCIIGTLAFSSCNSFMRTIENPEERRIQGTRVPVEFALDQGVGRVTVDLTYSLKNSTHRDYIDQYGYGYSKDLFSAVVTHMVTDTFEYQDMYAIMDYKNIHTVNLKRDLKKHYMDFDLQIETVRLSDIEKLDKPVCQIQNNLLVERIKDEHQNTRA